MGQVYTSKDFVSFLESKGVKIAFNSLYTMFYKGELKYTASPFLSLDDPLLQKAVKYFFKIEPEPVKKTFDASKYTQIDSSKIGEVLLDISYLKTKWKNLHSAMKLFHEDLAKVEEKIMAFNTDKVENDNSPLGAMAGDCSNKLTSISLVSNGVYTHIKRGTQYQHLGAVVVQSDLPLKDNAVLQLYRDVQTGSLYVRPASEFFDTERFVKEE